ncbi:hypothetical protein E4U27_004575 [Claviceps purpurea]|nr:hypothetical protein E4U27_004575 [Claviceps purpurea]
MTKISGKRTVSELPGEGGKGLDPTNPGIRNETTSLVHGANPRVTKRARNILSLFTSRADYDSGSGRCEPIGRNVVAPDRFREDCHQAGTVDGFYRYNKDDTVDTSQTFWVQDTSATCD